MTKLHPVRTKVRGIHPVVNLCQVLVMVVILTGILKSLIIYIKDALFDKKAFDVLKESRLEIGHAFSLGLAFLIRTSILKTILAPTWSDIGQLAAIITIRPGLNFFLLRDLESLFKNMKNKNSNLVLS